MFAAPGSRMTLRVSGMTEVFNFTLLPSRPIPLAAGSQIACAPAELFGVIMKVFLALLAAIFIGSCATVTTTAEFKPSTETATRRERNYELNAESAAVVGEPIVRVRDFIERVTEYPAMEANEPFSLTGGPVTLTFAPGERLAIAGERVNDGITYTVLRKGWYGIQVVPDGSIGPGVINGLGGSTQVLMAYRFSPSSQTARFIRTVARDVRRTATGQNFEIVFNGIDGQTMRFQYREYTASDMARPAFFQDLSYPLSSRTIRFRSISIDVAAVDAQQITYTVRTE